MQADAIRWPKIASAYERAMGRCITARIDAGLPNDFADGREMFDWWCGRTKRTRAESITHTCAHCGDDFTRPQGKGRKPIYCGDTCRQAAHRAR